MFCNHNNDESYKKLQFIYLRNKIIKKKLKVNVSCKDFEPVEQFGQINFKICNRFLFVKVMVSQPDLR